MVSRPEALLHGLLGVRTEAELFAHPKCGASWEGYAIEEILKAVRPDEAYYWATYQGAELDLLMLHGGKRLGVEIKRADAPTVTRSMRTAFSDLQLERLVVLYPGSRSYPLADGIAVMPLADLATGGAAALGFRRPVRRRP